MSDRAPDLRDHFNALDDGRVIVPTGAAERTVVVGTNIARPETKHGSREAIRIYGGSVDKFHCALDVVVRCVIVYIRDYCLGGGLPIAMDCDIKHRSVISAFCIPPAKHWIVSKIEGIHGLAWTVGPHFTADIFYAGREFDAQEARRMGLPNRVMPHTGLGASVSNPIHPITPNAPPSIRAITQALTKLTKPEPECDLDALQDVVAMCKNSQDHDDARCASVEEGRQQIWRR